MFLAGRLQLLKERDEVRRGHQSAKRVFPLAVKLRKSEMLTRKEVEPEWDTTVEQVCQLFLALQEAEKNSSQAVITSSQVEILQAKITKLEEKAVMLLADSGVW